MLESLRRGQLLVGRFRVEVITDRGAVAWDEELERPVEIEPLIGDHPWETHRLAAVIHPNLQTIYAVSVADTGERFVVREYLPGVPLGEWIELYGGGALPIDAAVAVLDPIIRALEVLHRAGRAHGHLDEHHVHVGPSFRVCLLCPRSAAATPPSATDDLHALGELAHRLLTGVTPQPGIAPSAHRPGLPRAFDRPLARMLGETPDSAETFQRRLALAQSFVAPVPRAHTFLFLNAAEELRETLAPILRQAFPGARFLYEARGTAALQTLRSREVSLVISELRRADTDGFELVAALHKERTSRTTPLLVVTGAGVTTDWRRLSGLGIDALLFKPVDASSLIANARRLIGAPAPPRLPGGN